MAPDGPKPARRARNPILTPSAPPEAILEAISGPVVHRQKVKTARRELRDARRMATAAEAIEGFDAETSIYGFTKGQFSLIDLWDAVLGVTGPARLVCSTWTAAGQDVSRVLQFIDGGRVLSARWLVDLTFCRRTPQLAARLRSAFGADAIRVAKNHAKFALIENDRWRIVVETSMNLNWNPRFENFRLSHDPALADFLSRIVDEVWHRQPRGMADERPYDIHKHFDSDL
jgi:hypothetical protein